MCIARLALLLPFALPLAACDEVLDQIPQEENEEAARAADSTDLGSLEAALLAAATKDVVLGDDADAMAAESVDAAAGIFTPDTCIQAVAAGNTVTWTLDNCSGPYGLAKVSGVANLVWSIPAADSVGVSMTAANLKVNDATLAVNVTGEIRNGPSNSREYTLSSTGGGVTKNNLAVTRTGSFGMKATGSCITLDGNWTTTVGESLWVTAITGFQRCEDACPKAGTVVWTGGDAADEGASEGRAVTITFDGSDKAAWATASGRVGRARLACGD